MNNLFILSPVVIVLKPVYPGNYLSLQISTTRILKPDFYA